MEKTVLERNPQSPSVPKRVAVYCRVAAGGTDPTHSLDAQKTYYLQKINENPDWKLAGVYADEGLVNSAAKKRKEFNRMLGACKRGRVDIILTKSVSRFSRNAAECLKTVRMLQDLGVTVIFEKENIDTSVDDSDMLMNLLCRFSEEECKFLSPNLICPVSKRPL